MMAPRSLRLASCLVALCAVQACSHGGGGTEPGSAGDHDSRTTSTDETSPPTPDTVGSDWLRASTVSLRNRIQVPFAGTRLGASEIVAQLRSYDPGGVLRCAIQDDPAYRAAVDALGGVTWGYTVYALEDTSQPEFRLGPPLPVQQFPSAAGANDARSAATPVEIEEADIVAVTPSIALFYSSTHGLLLVDLSGTAPRFVCAAKLPGQVKNFFYYRDRLVAMVGSTLLHFKLAGGALQFVEALPLRGAILDTRRFNDKLVVYTRLALGPAPGSVPPTNGSPGRPTGVVAPVVPVKQHRALQVFRFGDKLVEELNESLINTSVDDGYLRSGAIADDTAPGAVVHTASAYGDAIWASDHYFVVTEFLDVTRLASWRTNMYQVCTRSHTVETPYRHCVTRYETRPNPNYVPPDNSSGDRACKGVTLADCLRAVAKAANPTVEVPVSTACEERTYSQWVCDAYESRSQRYPELNVDSATRLTIYEYTPEGFRRLDGKVRSVVTHGELDGVPIEIKVDKLTTSSETFDLSIPGHLQTLNFQNGYLYAVASGMLQVYAMGEASLVRTSSLRVANESLQSSLFSANKLYLSDFGFAPSGMDRSTLRVIDLSNGAFPKQVSQDYQLPGGHASILPTAHGILTIGSVLNFENVTRNAVKLGLFTDPFASEKAYLILATELSSVFLSESKSHYFDASMERLYLPYTGVARDGGKNQARIGISHLAEDAIASDGALGLSEPVQRVRGRPGSPDQALGFGANTVVWINPDGAAFSASPVLAHYTPIALYRRSDADEYVEVSRLGESCKLSFATKATLAARSGLVESAAFECGAGMPLAYGDNLLFGNALGVHFEASGEVTALDAARVTELLTKATSERRMCLFSTTPTATPIDYAKLPPADSLTCYSRSEYQALVWRIDAGGAARP